jgi:2-C-methyl-D-erythritol 4-phosphate cytidylyltransferase/2-C-methyl-D-erythritol 2,4-cyclodiphosphate synthase
MTQMPRTAALIVAAGVASRFGGDIPKQYRVLAGRTVLRRSIEAMRASPDVTAVRVVIRGSHRAAYDAAVAGLDLPPPVEGGDTRQASVLAGLEALVPDAPDLVLIHDAARPLVGPSVVGGVVRALASADGAIAALPVVDTLRRVEGGFGAGTVPREGLWAAQTPQGFRFPAILAAHRAAAGMALTDDAAVAEHAGLAVAMVEGDRDNFKITTEDDLLRAERLLSGPADIRVGQGFDVHRFAEGGDHVMLCGVAVPHGRGVEAHSDGDVGLHAATDALLGAIAAGDIGQHFPPSDMRWRGAESAVFLRHAGDLVARRGTLLNLDLTILCEAPRVGPHRRAMAARIAEILGIEADRVSIKATTTERLGFLGRGEGIAAQATATVRIER